MKISRLLLLLLACSAAPATAAEPPAAKSPNVTWLRTVAEPGAVSARFRDGRMYLSHLRGLSIYDVRTPAEPRLLGSLELPHFENEDVEVGRIGDMTVMLISNDPSEGRGELHVIDVTDPAAPRRISSLATGVPDAAQGVILDFFNAWSPVKAPNPAEAGTGHTASCVQDCRYVYLAGTALGVDVVDLSDPYNPRLARDTMPMPESTGGVATHDFQFDRHGLAWAAGYGGTVAYDISDPLNPRKVFETDPSAEGHYIDDTVNLRPNTGDTLNDYVHHNSMRLPNKGGRDSNTVVIVEEDYTRPGCEGAGSVQTWRIGDDGVLRNLDFWEVEADRTRGLVFCSAHYFDERDRLLAQGFYEQGTRFLDVSDPGDIRQVGYWIPRFTETWGALYPPTDRTGEIVYALDLVRGIDVLRIARPGKKPRAALNRRMRTVRAPRRRVTAERTAELRAAGFQRAAFGGLCRLPRLGIG